jgi:PBSX family phage terminase large subunit
MSFTYAPFSKKQKLVMGAPLKRVNLLDGAVRSGKTIASIVRWLLYVGRETSPGSELLMLGVSERTLYRNVVDPLIDIAGARFADYTKGKLKLFGRTCWCIGADDAAAERRIRGMTVEGAYVDEATLIPAAVLKQSRLRCSAGKGSSIWTTNPDSPFHEIHKEWIEKRDEIGHRFNYWHFNLDDNHSLTEEYRQELREGYTGLWYRRFIEGIWCLAEGVIYDLFNLAEHGYGDEDEKGVVYDWHDLALDYGTQNPFAALLIGGKGEDSRVRDEYYYSGREAKVQKTDDEYIADLIAWLADWGFTPGMIRWVIVDPSAASIKAALKKAGFRVKDAKNDVLPGISTVATRLHRGRLKIHRKRCPNTIKEFAVYQWDAKAVKRGEDKPVKENDHALDGLRYHQHTIYGGSMPVIKTAQVGTRR